MIYRNRRSQFYSGQRLTRILFPQEKHMQEQQKVEARRARSRDPGKDSNAAEGPGYKEPTVRKVEL
jgi:hypothetical protein